MKSVVSTILTLLALGPGSLAQATVTDFQTLITESIEAKKDLSNKLRKRNVPAETGHEKVVIQEADLPAENIVAPSQNLAKSADPVGDETYHFEQKNMNRVSQELNDAQ